MPGAGAAPAHAAAVAAVTTPIAAPAAIAPPAGHRYQPGRAQRTPPPLKPGRTTVVRRTATLPRGPTTAVRPRYAAPRGPTTAPPRCTTAPPRGPTTARPPRAAARTSMAAELVFGAWMAVGGGRGAAATLSSDETVSEIVKSEIETERRTVPQTMSRMLPIPSGVAPGRNKNSGAHSYANYVGVA